MKNHIYYKHKLQGILFGIIDALMYVPKRFENNTVSVYGIETAKSFKCKNCKHTVGLFWEDGEVYIFLSKVMLDGFVIRCEKCLGTVDFNQK